VEFLGFNAPSSTFYSATLNPSFATSPFAPVMFEDGSLWGTPVAAGQTVTCYALVAAGTYYGRVFLLPNVAARQTLSFRLSSFDAVWLVDWAPAPNEQRSRV